MRQKEHGYSIAGAIRYARLARGLSQGDVADRLGVARTWISKLENERATPCLKSALRVAAAMEISPRDLFALAESKIGRAFGCDLAYALAEKMPFRLGELEDIQHIWNVCRAAYDAARMKVAPVAMEDKIAS